MKVERQLIDGTMSTSSRNFGKAMRRRAGKRNKSRQIKWKIQANGIKARLRAKGGL